MGRPSLTPGRVELAEFGQTRIDMRVVFRT